MAGRILVLSASVGAGHMRAAQAVELALRELAPGAEVKNVDILTLTNAAFRKVYGEAYLDLVNKAPHVLGYFYDLLDQGAKGRTKRDRFRLFLEKFHVKRFCELIECAEWDVAVCTHFLPAEVIAWLRRDKGVALPQITVTTDFETHRLWVNEPCDHYCTATAEGRAYLHHWGVPTERVSVTGIPIHPVFAKPKDPAECRRKHGLADDGRPVLLQLAGGFGVGPIEKLYRAVLDVTVPLQVVVVAGKNAKAKAQVEGVEAPARHRVKVMGFTDQIDELMAAADIVLSKPGGLTSSEALARGCTMVIVNPIPGQESRNSDYLLENGAAIKINNAATLPHKLTELLESPKRLASLKANARKIARPQAAYDAARLALKWVKAGRPTARSAR